MPIGLQAAEEGDDDRGEAVAGGELGRQLAERAGDFDDAGEAGEAAAEEQREPDGAASG